MPLPPWLDQSLDRHLGGPTATKLEKHLGLRTVGDLLHHYPRRYHSRGELTDLSGLVDGEHVSVVAKVVRSRVRQMRQRSGWMAEVVIGDDHGELDLVFFARRANLKGYWERQFADGRVALFAGRVNRYRERQQLVNPDVEPLDRAVGADEAQAMADELVPIYAATKDVATWVVRRSVRTLLAGLTADEVPDPVPAEMLAARNLPGRADALLLVHQPTDPEQYQRARRRLRFEEAFVTQTALVRRRAQAAALPATARPTTDGGVLAAFDARLPFTLTAGQQAVGATISAELAREHPMHRLLQGEVGSGKTVVALRAMLTVVDSGGQAALLAPTEVLASQHLRSVTAMLGDLAEAGMLGGAERGTRVTLLTGALSAGARRRALLEIVTGEAGIVIGTHALIQDAVEFADLGLVVVDEQHRFGVEQRDALRAKAVRTPHLLVMTATPIPRTVAMTVFGDLETSTLTELPAGRQPITTHVVPMANERWMQRTWQVVADEVAAGRRAYVVCPRIGDADDGSVLEVPQLDELEAELGLDGADALERRPPLSALDVLERLHDEPALAGVRFGLLHGRLPTEEKDAVMAAFAGGDLDVLVATTVVEVGVDVPAASVMVVMDAERFGISQLHQLRGRVGRGEHPSVCFLVSESAAAVGRLEAVAATTDGFALAQLDLETRREGDVLGAAQSGLQSSLRLLRVVRDGDVIADARTEAVAIVGTDPDLAAHPELARHIARLLDPEREVFLERG